MFYIFSTPKALTMASTTGPLVTALRNASGPSSSSVAFSLALESSLPLSILLCSLRATPTRLRLTSLACKKITNKICKPQRNSLCF